MTMKNHFLITALSLLFLGLLLAKPGSLFSDDREQRTCKVVKGKMDCFYKYSQYRINANHEVRYQFN
jgi:hypothetical protein